MFKLLFIDRVTDSTILTEQCQVELMQSLSVHTIGEDKKLLPHWDNGAALVLLISGIARLFINTHDGRDVTQHFLRAEDFVLANYTSERGIVERVEAITDLQYVSISNRRFEELCAKHHCLLAFLASFANDRALHIRDRASRFARSEDVATYESFLQTHPGLETQVPTAHLASYLGFTTSQFMRARQKYRDRGIM